MKKYKSYEQWLDAVIPTLLMLSYVTGLIVGLNFWI
jgi:hypothetical protein